MNMTNTTERNTPKTALNPFSELHLAQAYYGRGQYEESLKALIFAEEKLASAHYPDLDAITDDLMELLFKKMMGSKNA
jgi:hypothetical protein